MMSLNKPTTASVLKKQVKYKLKAYFYIYFSLMVLQIIANMFSFSGPTSTVSIGSSTLNVDVRYYTADGIIVFTMIWAFITGNLLTTKTYRNSDFSFVTNRVSSNLSNGLFLATASIIAGTTAMLSTFLQKVVLYYIGEVHFAGIRGSWGYPQEILLGIGSATLYMLLFSAAGYLVGTLVQRNKVFAFILPAIFFGFLFTLNLSSPTYEFVKYVYEFFFKESSFTLFTLKALTTVVLLFACSTALSNRLEVRS